MHNFQLLLFFDDIFSSFEFFSCSLHFVGDFSLFVVHCSKSWNINPVLFEIVDRIFIFAFPLNNTLLLIWRISQKFRWILKAFLFVWETCFSVAASTPQFSILLPNTEETAEVAPTVAQVNYSKRRKPFSLLFSWFPGTYGFIPSYQKKYVIIMIVWFQLHDIKISW